MPIVGSIILFIILCPFAIISLDTYSRTLPVCVGLLVILLSLSLLGGLWVHLYKAGRRVTKLDGAMVSGFVIAVISMFPLTINVLIYMYQGDANLHASGIWLCLWLIACWIQLVGSSMYYKRRFKVSGYSEKTF